MLCSGFPLVLLCYSCSSVLVLSLWQIAKLLSRHVNKRRTELNCPQLHYHGPLHKRHKFYLAIFQTSARRGVVQTFALLRRYATLFGIFCRRRFGIQAWLLRMRPRSCPEILVTIKLRIRQAQNPNFTYFFNLLEPEFYI